MFVTSSQDQTIKLWNIVYGNCLKVMTGHNSPIDTLAVNEDIIVSACDASIRYGDVSEIVLRYRVWDRHTGNPLGFQGLGIKRKATDIALWEDKIIGNG
jgi:WD40 repeat protein